MRSSASPAPVAALLLAWCVAAPARAQEAPGAEFELPGAWHVLIHYRDVSGAEADLPQWDDRLWTFEPEPGGVGALRWTEYPVVAFDRERGRFRGVLGQGSVREVGHWEPDAAQRREIERGLEASPRGARHRTLRRTPDGWSSEADAGSAYDSARFVTWSSVFRVTLGGAAPRFEIQDALGSSAAEAIRGRTLFAGERVLEGGRVVEGRYDRDGRHLGTFRMTRSGGRRLLEAERAAAPDAREVYERFYRELGRQLRTHRALPDHSTEGDATAAGREALQARVRGEIEVLYRAQGNDPRPHAPQVEKLSVAITGLYVDEGRSRDEIGRLLQEGALRP